MVLSARLSFATVATGQQGQVALSFSALASAASVAASAASDR